MAPYYIDIGRAQATLRPRILVFAGSLSKAVWEWNNGLGKYHATIDQFARGVLISQLWYSYSSQALRSDVGVSLARYGNGYYYIVDNLLVLRFKHVDDSYRSWNHPTPRARAWSAQVSFPTMPPMAKLELGYRLDLTGTVVEDAMVMLKYGEHSLWRWQIWGHPISEFAAAPRDIFGRVVYAHDDFSGAVLP